ncbi:hypothetical protein JCM8208_003379 [Rhodotorula glutinis]
MTFSTATLFYGITVSVTSLCFTATAYVDVKPALLAIDLVRARRDIGRLETSLSSGARGVLAVPSEVWQLVKKHLVLEMLADQVDTFVRRRHSLPNCRCCGCEERSRHWDLVHKGRPADRPRRFTLDDLYDRPTPQVRVEADIGDPDNGCWSQLVEISPAIFALPVDAPARFHRLLKTFSTLEPTSPAVDSIRSSSEHANATSTRDRYRGGDGGSGEGLLRAFERVSARAKAAGQPKWLLLGQTVDPA